MTDTAQSPLDIVRACMSAMMVKDYDTGLAYFSEDCEYENMPMAKVHGHAGVRAVLEPFFAPTLENEFKVLHAVANGPVVMMERLDRHRLPDRWVELPVMGVWEVHDGKIILWRDYFDAATILSVWPS